MLTSRGYSVERLIEGVRPVAPEDVTVLIPTLNEAEAIGRVLDEVQAEGYTNILVVDGYSQDGTAAIAAARGARVIAQHGAGKAGALKTGVEHVATPYLLVMDGDYTYAPGDGKRMLPHAPAYDEVIGVRSPENIPHLHRLGNRIINTVFNLLFGTGLSDVCSGLYLLRTEVLRTLPLRSRGFSVEVEIVAGVSTMGRVTEVPVRYRKRVGDKKLQTFREGVRILSAVVGLAWSYNPVFLLALLASLLALPGVVLTVWQLALRYVYGAAAWSMGVVWLGLFLLIIGVQGFTVATITVMLKRMERRLLRQREGRDTRA